jgi:hypothetical protein
MTTGVCVVRWPDPLPEEKYRVLVQFVAFPASRSGTHIVEFVTSHLSR